MHSNHHGAVAFGDLKDAALYYDYVIPVFVAIDYARGEWPEFSKDAFLDLLPPDIMTLAFGERLADLNDKGLKVLKKFLIRDRGLEPRLAGLTDAEYAAVEEAAARAYFAFISDFHLRDWPIAAEDGPATAWMPDDEPATGAQLLLLSRLALVNASRASWAQIMDFRKDATARQKLRKLRLFAYDNYTGKTPAYIEDDVQARIFEYEQVTRKWGFETAEGAIGSVLSSKTVAAAAGGTLASIVSGHPALAIAVATAGATLEIGRFALELVQKRLALQALANDQPISYLKYARDAFPQEDGSGSAKIRG